MDQGNDEFDGKNLDVAIWKASQQLGIPIEKLRYTILSPGKRGPGGVSLEPARIRILSGDAAPPPPATPAPRTEPADRERSPAARPEHQAPIRAADPQDEAAEDEMDAAAGQDDAEDEEIDAAPSPEALDDDLDEEEEIEEEETDEDDTDVDAEPLEDDDDLEDLPMPMPTSLEEDDPIEEARRARQDRGGPPERRAEPPEPVAPARPDPPERQRPPRRERHTHAAPRAERSQPPPREEARALESEAPGGEPSGGAPAVEDLEGGMARAREVLPELLAEMGFELTSEFALEEDHVYVALTGDDAAYLVDDRAEGLNSLQYLLNKMVYRGGPTRIVVDANGYRKDRQQEIVARAIELAQEVRDSGEPRSLGTLNPFERRLVHMALRDDPSVRTVSHGDAFLKRLEITPKRGDDVERSPRFPSGWDREGSTGRHGRPRGSRGRGGR